MGLSDMAAGASTGLSSIVESDPTHVDRLPLVLELTGAYLASAPQTVYTDLGLAFAAAEEAADLAAPTTAVQDRIELVTEIENLSGRLLKSMGMAA